MNYKPPFTPTDKIQMLCIEISEMVGQVSAHHELTSNVRLHRKLRIQTIHSSLLIEGNQLSSHAVTALLDGKRVLGNPRDILEVENAQNAYALLPKLQPYSIPDLLKVHKTMMKGLQTDAGCFRSGNVGVFDGSTLIHAGTPAPYVPKTVKNLFTWLAQTKLHPLVASSIFHFEFEFIHPFSDGNGRCGRLWQTLLLSRWRPIFAWLPVESSIQKQQSQYYKALAASDKNASSETFVEFMLGAIKDSLSLFVQSPLQSSSNEMLNKALDFFANNSFATIAFLAAYLGISQRSAERVAAKLKAEKRLGREGSARKGRWIVLSPGKP